MTTLVLGTPGNDSIRFTSTEQQFTMTLVNAYSSNITIFVNEILFVNNAIYDGDDGNDLLQMTLNNEVLLLINALGEQTFYNIETVFASSGNDIVDLSSTTISFGDLRISGSFGHDILWANDGNDEIRAGQGDDNIHGGPGNDWIFGDAGADLIHGWTGDDEINGGTDEDLMYGDDGDDILNGGSENDTIYGGAGDGAVIIVDKVFTDTVVFPTLVEGVNIQNLTPPATPALGVNADNLTLDFKATATLTFRDGFAGYNNSLGVYRIAADGSIEMASLLWENVKDAGIDTPHQIELPVGEDGGSYGFFIIADGDRTNSDYNGFGDTGVPGHIKFIYHYGQADERTATIHDHGPDITAVYDDGATVKVLKGYIYHTTPRDAEPTLNWDGQTHAVSGLVTDGDGSVLRIGFEDLPNLGDADYEDVLFDLDINETITIYEGEEGNDLLNGEAGDDILYGEAGDDLLIGGTGNDHMYGGAGADTFLYRAGDISEFLGPPPGDVSYTDTIYDFDAAEGDVLDIADILTGFDSGDDINDFVQLIDNGGSTDVYVNFDGQGDDAHLVVTVIGGFNGTLADLVADGTLVVS